MGGKKKHLPISLSPCDSLSLTVPITINYSFWGCMHWLSLPAGLVREEVVWWDLIICVDTYALQTLSLCMSVLRVYCSVSIVLKTLMWCLAWNGTIISLICTRFVVRCLKEEPCPENVCCLDNIFLSLLLRLSALIHSKWNRSPCSCRGRGNRHLGLLFIGLAPYNNALFVVVTGGVRGRCECLLGCREWARWAAGSQDWCWEVTAFMSWHALQGTQLSLPKHRS